MTYTFKAPLFPKWTIDNDVITVGRKTVRLDEVVRARYTPCKGRLRNGVIQCFLDGNKFITLPFPYKQMEDGDKVARYILEKVKNG